MAYHFRRNADGDVTTTHAPIGTRLVVGIGATVGAGIGYTGNPPSGAIFQTIVELMIPILQREKMK